MRYQNNVTIFGDENSLWLQIGNGTHAFYFGLVNITSLYHVNPNENFVFVAFVKPDSQTNCIPKIFVNGNLYEADRVGIKDFLQENIFFTLKE